MARHNIVKILRRLLEDEAFRQLFFRDPEAALSDYDLTSSERRWFRRITGMDSLLEWSRKLDVSLKSGSEMTGPAEGTAAEEPVPERIVSTGFAAEAEPATPLPGNRPLLPHQAYYFWLEVGAPVAGSIEETPTALPADLPEMARLQVALFPFESEFEITAGADVGELEIKRDGTVRVARPAASPPSLQADDLLSRRLFFPVNTPPQAGAHRLRCNIYYRQVLLQSRLITMHVMDSPRPMQKALTSAMDYTLSHTLSPRQLAGMAPHRLSLMLNDDGDGTHGFRFLGQDQFKSNASLGEGELQDLIEMARGAMRAATWGDEEPYNRQKTYRYQQEVSLDQLGADLIRFARRGYRFYDALINRLAGDARQAMKLAQIMLESGQVQIATRQSSRLVVPAALFYDYPLDTSLKADDYTLCPAFVNALKGPEPLENTACFRGNCASYGEDTVICPSGFWGYRHRLGLPVSVAGGLDAPATITCADGPELTVGVSTDPAFEKRPQHEQALQNLQPELTWNYADTRDETLAKLKTTTPHLVYFYCHGGIANGVPYIHVGPKSDRGITRDNLRAKRIFWQEPRPLVFINGCYTTALEPESAIDLVSGFVENAFAAGVIGTEITIFEPVAVAFAEECLHRFLVARQPIGEAVRGARLKLLQQKNPLGLVYIPYVMADLRLN